jgi:hypothetical protein
MLRTNFNNTDSMFSYEPIRIVKSQNKKTPDQLKKIYETKIALAEHNLFNSRDLLQRKINKVDESIQHLTNKLANINENVFYETTLYGKISILKVQLFRLKSRFDFLNNNQDIIPYLPVNIDDSIHFEESI